MTTKWDELKLAAEQLERGAVNPQSLQEHTTTYSLLRVNYAQKAQPTAVLDLITEVEQLAAESARNERNRDMWKEQCERQSEKLHELLIRIEQLTEENDRVRAANLEGVDWVNAARADIDQLTQRLNETLEKHRATFSQLEQKARECEELRSALFKIIEMNRQHAEDQYGDPDKAERWSCVTVAREAMAKEGASNG